MTLFWCYPAAMAKQDDWIRITLRLPPELHQRLSDEAGAKSLNAEIVARLEDSFAEVELPLSDQRFVRRLITEVIHGIARETPDATLADVASTLPDADAPDSEFDDPP